MADNTKIEWTEATWNPITGCSVISSGCTNCYAMHLAGTRLAHHESRAGVTREVNGNHVWTGEVRFNEKWLDQPLRWKRPRMIFVCAHGDLFHESVPDPWIDRIFAVMGLCPQHTFQVLTKRSSRMREYITKLEAELQANTVRRMAAAWPHQISQDMIVNGPNVWLGVSVEDQQRADERIPDLLATPAAVRWISAEPLLGPVDLCEPTYRGEGGITMQGYLRNEAEWDDFHFFAAKLDWVVAGGESGKDARPMHPDWARSLRDQCAAADVPFFFKQWGEFAPAKLGLPCTAVTPDGAKANGWDHDWQKGDANMARVGKKRAGRLLDGALHDGMPGQ